MARHGFIHDKLDIKLLILYFMSRVAAPVDFATVTGLTLCDDGIDYFLFAEALSELVGTGHLTLEKELYAITDKGRADSTACESSLPFSVKRKCIAQLAKLNGILRRNAQVRAETASRPDGGFTVRMFLDDEGGNLLTLELFCGSQEPTAWPRTSRPSRSASTTRCSPPCCRPAAGRAVRKRNPPIRDHNNGGSWLYDRKRHAQRGMPFFCRSLFSLWRPAPFLTGR